MQVPRIFISEASDSRTPDFNPLFPLIITHLPWSKRNWKSMSSMKNNDPSGFPAPQNSYSRIDVETGAQHAHKRPYTPGASPREIIAACSQSQRAGYSPRGTRYMEGYRRRMRQASLNLPSDTKLDEDLGFPPVCSPPPEVFCGLIGDNRMRSRSKSDAHQGMLSSRKLSGTNSNGGGMGGLLVFFPSSPTSSIGQVNSPRHESSTDETCPGAVKFWSNSSEMEEIEDDVSMKSVDTKIGSSQQNSNIAQGSPRARPLFVDTQIANQDNLKKRKEGIEHIRYNYRAVHFFGGSPSSPSPQSIAARASASCDTQPIASPGRRQTFGGRFQRFTGNGPKSFDSGLDLTSPTINHTALLIKEPRCKPHALEDLDTDCTISIVFMFYVDNSY
ncbi:unnamed protein product [Caenorhabditis angaria]|uniref:Uncharacterized protein n=1 Tax=Caenorhabditis angaria TaxID=860376 RepID=A0A9P1IKB0_9PELO|nr:unnamed protein product [Caenorhabditis angaria]